MDIKQISIVKDMLVNPEEVGPKFLENWKWWITIILFCTTGPMVAINFVLAHFVEGWLLMGIFVLGFLPLNTLNVANYLVLTWIAFRITKDEKRIDKVKVLSYFYLVSQLIFHMILYVPLSLLIILGYHPYTIITYDYSKFILYFWIVISSIAYLYSIEEDNLKKNSIIVTVCFFGNSALNTFLNQVLISMIFILFGG